MTGYIPVPPSPWVPTATNSETKLFPDDTMAALNATIAGAIGNSFRGVKARLDAGVSATQTWLTDSTGNHPTDEHIGKTAAAIGALYPNHRVRFKAYDNGGPDRFSAFGWTQIQAGVGGERKVTFDGASNACLALGANAVNSITGDMRVSARVSNDNWSNAASQTIACKFGNAGTRSWWWYIGNGWMYFTFTVDGTTQITRSANMSAIIGSVLVNGDNPVHVRVEFDADNGASGHSASFWRSTDGASWTQISTTSTASPAVTLFTDATTDLNIGARTGGASDRWDGSIYEVVIEDGLTGKIVAPTLPDMWSPSPSTFNGVISGAPTLDVWAAAASGWGTGQFVSRLPKMIPMVGQSQHLMGTSHNEGFNVDDALWRRWDTCLAALRTQSSIAEIAVFNENPQTAPQSALAILTHATRCRDMKGYASARGYQFIDVFQAFADYSGPISDLVQAVDGVHPTVAGSNLWSLTERRAFGLA